MERIIGKWKTAALLLCGILVLQESPTNVSAEQTFVDSNGNTHFLDGYDAHNHLMSSLELIIGETVKDTLNYTLQFTEFQPGFFLTNVDNLSYSFLQFFQAVLAKDITFANLFIVQCAHENGTFSNWLMTNINFPEEHVYKVVKTISKGSGNGLSPLPNILIKEILLMNRKYNYFRMACSRGERTIIQWALQSGLPLDQFGPDALQSAWEGKQWEVVKMLVGNKNFPLKNITYISNLINEQRETILHFAAETDNTEYIISLLKAGANINAVDIFSKCPLQRAIEAFMTSAVYVLLSNGANINHETESADSLLHITAKIGNYEATNLLIKEGFDLERKNGDGLTAFNVLERVGVTIIFNKLLARCSLTEGIEDVKKIEMKFTLSYGNICIFHTTDNSMNEMFLKNLTTIAKMLRKKGAQSDLKDEDKVTLLYMAIDNKLSGGVNFLLETGITAQDISRGLQRAVLADDALTMKCLLDAGADMNLRNSDGWKPIHVAASKGNIQAVTFLLQKGDDVNSITEKGETVLHIAVLSDQSEIVNLLLERGANVKLEDSDGMQPIHVATLKGLAHVTQLLLTKGANVNARDLLNKTPLFHASHRGFVNLVRILLDNEANVNAQASGGGTALHAAIWGGLQSVLLLLNRGAYINARDNENKTALYQASSNGITDVVKLLIERGADISISDDIGCTPLCAASQNGFVESVILLLKNGANVDTMTSRRETPLFLAAQNGHYPVARRLLQKGADVNATNNKGVSPLQAAQSRGNTGVMNLLKENGA